MMALLSLKILETEYSIYQFSEKHQVPDTIFDSEFLSISYAVDEITVICQSNLEINSKVGDGDWTCIQLVGEFDLEIKGVWAKITSIVAEAGSPVLAITTYNTDYFLVKTASLNGVKELFKKNNFKFI
ncbi:MAG: hypothetical protein CMG55_10425 [Candidatus Marinimicrobia bacterium]|nr:hypothetical protein [Candidatus Neomarinimicrobiota bacterium]|tara:strand:- start:1574 stop:1957 length:384 start_codon:yes stop_codon:yes gene_type:complete